MGEVHGSLAFYKELLQKICAMEWAQVCLTALKFVPFVEKSWPSYLEEMKGNSTLLLEDRCGSKT
jgi:isopenicillin-N N-acyltransferase-like protein